MKNPYRRKIAKQSLIMECELSVFWGADPFAAPAFQGIIQIQREGNGWLVLTPIPLPTPSLSAEQEITLRLNADA